MRTMMAVAMVLWLGVNAVCAQALTAITPGEVWPDDKGEHINAHGGNVMYHEGTYYWYGENRPARGFTTEVGVGVYSSKDLMNWKNEGVALAVSETKGDVIERGCIMERPKVVYNPTTKKFVMLFHLELKGRGYEAARVGFAVSDTPTGPFKFIRSLRPNAGKWPMDFTKRDIKRAMVLDENDWGRTIPRFGTYGETFAEELRPYIDALNTCYGTLHCPEAEQWAERALDEHLTHAEMCDDRAYAQMSRRAVLMGFLLDLLPSEFTRQMAQDMRIAQGRKPSPRKMLSQWTYRGYIAYDEPRGVYVKTGK